METELERARRHVVEGRKRIARHQALLAELKIDNHDYAVYQARRLLAVLQEAQNLAEEHLARLEREAD